MAPKRKAPVSSNSSSKPSSAQPKAPHPPGSKRPALSAKKLKFRPPPAKKARVEVEYEESTPSALAKGKGKAAPSAERKGEVNGRPLKKKELEKRNAASSSSSVAPIASSSSSAGAVAGPSSLKGKGAAKKIAFADTEDASSSTPAPSATSRTPFPRPPPKAFQIITGSYEKLLYGLSGTFPSTSTPLAERDYALKPIFIFPAHQACVKAVGASEGGKWLATGSTDEVVKIWDLRRRKEVGGLIQHSGSITALLFPTPSHLLTASEDATLTLFRTRDWTMLRSFKGHTGRINAIAVHPTGKLALSVGKDRTLRMWDLMRGKASGSVKLGKEGEAIHFSPSGETFAVLSTTTIDLWTKDMSPITTLTNPKRFHDFHFVEIPAAGDEEDAKPRELLVAACEEGYARVWERVGGRLGDVGVREENWREIAKLEGHTNRVKSLSVLYPLVSTVSSDGFVNLYDLSALPVSPPSDIVALQPSGQYDTKGTRLTCVTLVELDEGAAKTGGAAGVESEDDGEDEEEWGGVGASDEDGEGGDEVDEDEEDEAEEEVEGEEEEEEE